MTELEKMQAITLKGKGKGYKVIASLLSLSENTVKSFLRREYKEEKFCKKCEIFCISEILIFHAIKIICGPDNRN